ncbi:MAG: SseB family protein [Streptosporangiaceae bacterium]
MNGALQSGAGQEEYFRLLAGTEVVVPLAPETAGQVLAGETQPTWPTQELDGRTHILVYTSPEAMRARLGQGFRHFIRLKVADMAAVWPEPRWWLAVNAGLPVQSLLPSWFLRQLAEGDHRPPQAGLAAPQATAEEPVAEPVHPEPEPVAPAYLAEPEPLVPVLTESESVAAYPAEPEPVMPAPLAEPAPLVPVHLAEADPVVPEPEPVLPEPVPVEPVLVVPQHVVPEPVLPEPVLPEPVPVAAEPVIERPRFVPANTVETELVRAADEESLVTALAEAELLLPVPVGTDPGVRPSRDGFPWQPGEIDGKPAVPAFTSPERLHDVIGEVDFVRLPFRIVIRHWPELDWSLAINPGTPIAATLTGDQLPIVAGWTDRLLAGRPGFEPQNELETRLYEAAQRDDIDTFLALLSSAQVMIASDPGTPWGARPADDDFPWQAVPVKGEPAILAFTSPRWMHEAAGQSRVVMPDFRELAASWPESGWSLVLNPGTPIDATISGSQLRSLTADATLTQPVPRRKKKQQETQETPVRIPADALPPVPAEPRPEPRPEPAEPVPAPPLPFEPFEPGNRIDQDLYEAAVSGDTDDFLRIVLAASVLVPIADTAPLDVTPLESGFDWSAALAQSSVQVFTSLVRLQEVLPGARFVYAGFPELIGSWRSPAFGGTAWSLHLNPGTRIGASLTGDQVRELSDWAERVGLPQRQAPREPAQPFAAPHTSEPTTTEPPITEPVQEPQPPASPPAPARPRTAIMQKVLPPGHVGWYLEQGYDRVGGFVHPIGDVAELRTPAQLYDTLGLLYGDSPFSVDDEAVHVLRWPAYCENLYRVPFGGQSEDELIGWGDAGWVVEQAPFLGTGFAPGSGGTIREYKCDSARLPSGAELYLLGRDRTERFVAVYDADLMAWSTTPVATVQQEVSN